MKKNIFELKYLIEFYKKIKRLGKTVTFSNISENENVFIIRHDIDLDPVPALKMARLEKEIGIQSTYFFMVSNQSYNILSEKNKKILSEISEMKFEIGLHFDPTVYKTESKEELQEKVKFEAFVLENIIEKEIRSISLHKPSVHMNFHLFENYINTYDKRFFSDNVYLSDSSMNFRGKDPFDFIENIKYHSLQILLHPLHFEDTSGSYTDILKNTSRRFTENIDNEFRAMNPTYKNTVEENIVDKILCS